MNLLARLLFFLFAVAILGCENTVTNPQTIVFPDSDVSYSQDIQPLFDLGCAVSGCHDGYTQAGNLRLTSYADLFQNPGIIHPNDSSGSKLVQVLRGRLPHPRIDELPPTENQIRGIAIWIQEGASNN